MSNRSLARRLRNDHVAHTPRIYEAFVHIDRRQFVPLFHKAQAYYDQALPIGHHQTISQPYTVGFMLELLRPETGNKVLDVGSGSGWTSALLAYIVGPQGVVHGVERIPELVDKSRKAVAKFNMSHLHMHECASGVMGLPEEAPFDRILVSAAAQEVPQELLDQLAAPGVLVMPIGHALVQVIKDEHGQVHTETYEGFLFVPLMAP
ncbi:MAG TPA: protein-L-isoaspartate(D-aspartate) O-methyltransferase [Verrucomicrobiae bacterium]|nr:protein-L-isoaspartate(D-aspartate) O-methyltransferase [Verrucomicrobiae bacterium]